MNTNLPLFCSQYLIGLIDIFDKDKPRPPETPHKEPPESIMEYPDEMILNSEILGIYFSFSLPFFSSSSLLFSCFFLSLFFFFDTVLEMLRGLGIFERTVDTFEKHSKELLQRARAMDPGPLQVGFSLLILFLLLFFAPPYPSSRNGPTSDKVFTL